MDNKRFKFSAKIKKRDFGRMYYAVVFAPKKIEKELELVKNPRLRIKGAISRVPFSGAFQPNGGEWYLILSKALLKDGGLALGDTVLVDFVIANQDEVDVPEDLMIELTRRKSVFQVWESLTPGRRRGLAHRVASAKREATREQRILEVIDTIMDVD